MSTTIKIEVGGWDVEQALQDGVTSAIAQRIERTDDEIERSIRDAVESRIRELSDERIREEVGRALSDGWSKTDSYGRETKKITLKDFILDHIKGDGYRSPLDSIFREGFERALKGELASILKAATDELRAKVDGAIAEKLRKAVTEALR